MTSSLRFRQIRLDAGFNVQFDAQFDVQFDVQLQLRQSLCLKSVRVGLVVLCWPLA
jgi:hypothetical protein